MNSPPRLIIASLIALASACGDDSASPKTDSNNFNNTTNNNNNNNNAQDMSGAPDLSGGDMSAPQDMSGGDMDAPSDMASSLRPYAPALVDPSDAPGPCATPLVTQPGALRARVFTTSLRVDLDHVTSHAAWRDRVHRFIWQHVLPCRAPDAPNVVVFPESISLPMVLIGDKAAPSRARADSASALALMATSLARPLSYYQPIYPDAPLPRLLLLAATDTLARATLDTFAQIADRHDLYIALTVNAAPWEPIYDYEAVAALGDSDHDGLGSAWRATSDRVHNVALLFGPDGQLIHRAPKLHLTPLEERVLGLLPGDFTQLSAPELPWGRTALVISDSARMPNVQDRLDDLAAAVYLEHQATPGNWAQLTPAVPGQAPRWTPDLAIMGGWSLVQRAPRAVALAVSRLTGNLFELGFDGQIQLIERPGQRSGQLIGQRGPLAGHALVGPWVIDDPGLADPSRSLDARREALRDAGEARQPAATGPERGQQIEGAWAMDLTHAAQPQVETHPALARAADHLIIALSAGAPGQRVIALRKLDPRAAQLPLAQLAHPDYDLIRPQLVVDASQNVHVVAEAIGKRIMGERAGAYDNRLIYARLPYGAAAFEEISLIASAGAWAYHPSLALANNTLHLTWTQQLQGGVSRAYYAQGVLDSRPAGSPFERAMPLALDARPAASQQWDARVAAAGQLVAAVWLDYRDRRWVVLAALSQDAGLSWSAPVMLHEATPDVISLHSSPTIAALGAGEFMVAWTHLTEGGLSSAIAARKLKAGPRGAPALGALHMLGSDQDHDRWARTPALATGGLTPATLAWVEQHQASVTVRSAAYDALLDQFIPRPELVAPGGAYGPQLIDAGPQRPGALVYESGGVKPEIVTKPR
jgi:hypothetical protein